jgi:hypothetical protein
MTGSATAPSNPKDYLGSKDPIQYNDKLTTYKAIAPGDLFSAES